MPMPSKFIVIENGFVTIRVKPGYNYEIDLNSIQYIEDLIRWRDHLSEKRWMSPKSLADFYNLVLAYKPLKKKPQP